MAGFHNTSTATANSSADIKYKTGFITEGYTVGLSETMITIPAGTVAFRVRAADSSSAVLTYSDTVGGTAGLVTSDEIPKYCSWDEEFLNLSVDLIIYIKSNTGGTPVQVTYWF